MQRYYLGGSQKLESTNAACVKSFRIDAGVQAAGTATTVTFPAGAMILGFQVVVTEAVSTGSSPTVQMGFTGTTMLSAAIAAATLVVGYTFGQDNSADAAPLTLSADDTFDCIVAVATLTTGKFDVHVTYIPRPELCDSQEHEYVTA
jgi:hypothetical protein